MKFSRRNKAKMVAVVTPMYTNALNTDEWISFRHLKHFLGGYDKFLLTPDSLRVNYLGFQQIAFSDRFFENTRTYSALLLSKKFYNAFRHYNYILIYQLDALVFSDQLLEWCNTGLDYIGAPWIDSEVLGHIETPTVGNGGFSLRKVQSFLKVLNSREYCVDPQRFWIDFCKGRPRHSRYAHIPLKYLKRLKMFNGVEWETANWTKGEHSTSKYGPNEDLFWSYQATKYYHQFKIASLQEALRFSFEVQPRQCFELNNHQLPFGCHAWAKYDREFWEPYLLK